MTLRWRPIATPALALALVAAVGERGAASSGRLEVLAINGGGHREINYQSHLAHVRMLVDVLRWSGVADGRITILSGDGPDPAADVALRQPQPEEDFWLLGGTKLEQALKTPVTFESTRVEGFAVKAATLVEVERWFEGVGSRLKDGDTLLLYVTDHGTKNAQDTKNNRITLWGKGQSLSVNELREKLARLDRKVRVVMLMSQCYSGSFTNALPLGGDGLPAGNVCGYFSTTAERPAYGCYPEVRETDNTGHSFDFIQELAQAGSFRNAQLHVLQHDVTPDAPLRTSDAFIEELLKRKASAKGVEYEAYADQWLAQAWKRKGAWEPEIRLLDSIGVNFGSFSPRTLAEIREQGARLPVVGGQLDTHSRNWRLSLEDANRANLGRFLEKRPAWAEQLKAARPGAAPARELAGTFVYELAEFARSDAAMATRLSSLRRRSETARALAYRMDVREGVVLRMRTVLASIAGREYLAREGSRQERSAYDALLGCEALALPLAKPVPGVRAAKRDPFPPLEDDLAAARDVVPAWMGIRFAEAPAAERSARQLSPGAASVTVVYPESPAQQAGLQAGDVVLGPPGAPFRDPGQIREWTMLAAVDQPAPLVVLRGDEKVNLSIVPKPYPVKWPELPGPPRVASAAPPWDGLRLSAYRGDVPSALRGSGPHLLYFWATWCGPCKAALPEVLDFQRERNTPVIAITDEEREALDAFFGKFDKPFPERVVTDEARRAFLAYGVSGTPTFVLVDGEGIIRSYSVGYSPAKGLGIEGWSWTGPGKSVQAAPPNR